MAAIFCQGPNVFVFCNHDLQKQGWIDYWNIYAALDPIDEDNDDSGNSQFFYIYFGTITREMSTNCLHFLSHDSQFKFGRTAYIIVRYVKKLK